MLKRTLSFLLVLALIAALPISAFAQQQHNLHTANTWAHEGITNAISRGFVPPDLQNHYTDTITRAEFCRLAIRWLEFVIQTEIDALLGDFDLERDPDAFSDTDDPDILAAYLIGITAGVGDGRFDPDGLFSREQAATMVSNIYTFLDFQIEGAPEADFADLAEASDWAQSSINFVYAMEIMRGTGNNRFTPHRTFTREESIVMFDNIAVFHWQTIDPANIPENLEIVEARIEMDDGGIIELALFPSIAPAAVANFADLANDGFYNGLNFHRIVPGFMIQGGCPEGTGMGGPGHTIFGEFASNGFRQNNLRHTRGVISMARAQDPNSAGSQFFICVADTPFLDGDYAAFGIVTSGMDVVDGIVEGPADGDRAAEPRVIVSIEIIES